ncbi:putative glycolipid-binding domain-containing protein [Herbiconiux sp. CPCC 205716]|uniref:Glycolipid-binding domain-containing protein n=1 Tax=Herbiconiux gentiana TaxID=2970912 RepID=A0ABT2GJ89_9MICO|nr:putative glycolipid-binding domain-containing protein [Herbiconiux gentiana]MCS5716292.1 putative glycolipid-binding domain-containing protein [Herbiconiux gentiana]
MPIITRSLAWVPSSRSGFEGLTLTLTPSGATAVGHITADPDDRDPERSTGFEVFYRIECDEAWRTRHVSVVENSTNRALELWSTGDGHWQGDDGRMLVALSDALDVDLSATPFSNTLPIRRIGLALGQSAEITTAYVDVPSLQVSADRQRYTRIAPSVYRYEALDGSFVRDVEVDDEGFVTDYPGLFTRVGR